MNRNSENYLHTQTALIKSLENPSDQQLKLVDLGARYLQGHRLTTAELRAMEALILCEKSRCRAEAAAAKAAYALKNEKVPLAGAQRTTRAQNWPPMEIPII